MPPTELPKLSDTILGNNKFLAENDGTSPPHVVPQLSILGNAILFNNFNIYTVDFQNEIYDAANIYNPSGNVLTVPITNKYNVQVNLGLKVVITRDTGSGPVDVSASMSCITATGVHIILYNSTTSTIAAVYDLNLVGASFGSANIHNAGITFNNVELIQGHTYYAAIKYPGVNLQYNASASGATWALNVYTVSGSNYSAEFSSVTPYEGGPVEMNTILPLNYKQSDFISDLVKTFHLYIKPNKNKQNDYIIEPRNDGSNSFYSGTPIDWEYKHDKSSLIEVIPMGELNFNNLTAQYSEDGDFYNKLYQDEYKESYGTYRQIVENDFIKNERVIKPSFAATPYAVNPSIPMVVPQILNKQNGKISEIKSKVRILYAAGLINLPTGISWIFSYNNGANSVTYNQFPAIGHTDNPYAPTLDLNFGIAKKVYFTYPNQQWTTNNLFNRFYSQYINMITDKDSKIIRTKFELTENDINLFDFQRPIFTTLNGQQGYYIVNKIEDYNPLVSETTMVELLKLTDYDPFVESTFAFNEGLGGGNSSWEKIAGDNINIGPNNTNYAEYSAIIGGNNNFIGNKSQSVTLINSENALVVTEENFLGVGLDENSEVDSNMVNLMDKVKIYSDGHGALAPRTLRVTEDFTIDGKYSIYEIDTSIIGVAITCTWDAVEYPIEVTFKMIDSTSGSLIIDDMTSPPSSPPQTIDGNSMPWNTAMITNDSLIVYSNGTNLKIKGGY